MRRYIISTFFVATAISLFLGFSCETKAQYVDDFEAPTYTAGDVVGQNGWLKLNGTDDVFETTNSQYVYGSSSLVAIQNGTGYTSISNNFANSDSGVQTFYVKIDSGSADAYFRFEFANSGNAQAFCILGYSGDITLSVHGSCDSDFDATMVSGWTDNVWYKISIGYNNSQQVRYSINDAEFSEWYHSGNPTDIEKINLSVWNQKTQAYFDSFFSGTAPTYFDNIIFTAPHGYLGTPPKTPYFIGNYSISTSSSWNAIRIKLKQWLYATSTAPLATSYTDTYLDYGNYKSNVNLVPFTSVVGQFRDGYYSYDAEFLSKNHSTGAIISEGGYSGMANWFWVGLSEGNPYSYPLASSTASTTALSLCEGIKPENIFDVVNGVQWALCNVYQWLFVPSDVSIGNFQSLSEPLQQKAPFAYFYSVVNNFTGLSSNANPAFNLSSSTGAFGTIIFQPIKTGLTWLLWFAFVFWVIKRIANFDF
jgi:hypothetical protein